MTTRLPCAAIPALFLCFLVQLHQHPAIFVLPGFLDPHILAPLTTSALVRLRLLLHFYRFQQLAPLTCAIFKCPANQGFMTCFSSFFERENSLVRADIPRRVVVICRSRWRPVNTLIKSNAERKTDREAPDRVKASFHFSTANNRPTTTKVGGTAHQNE